MAIAHSDDQPTADRGRFASTHWSVVLAAARTASPEAAAAMEKLCQTYWYPLYAYLRRSGQPPLPTLFDEALARRLGPFRRFRHVVHHGYGFQIERDRIREGLDQADAILTVIRDRVADHVKNL